MPSTFTSVRTAAVQNWWFGHCISGIGNISMISIHAPKICFPNNRSSSRTPISGLYAQSHDIFPV